MIRYLVCSVMVVLAGCSAPIEIANDTPMVEVQQPLVEVQKPLIEVQKPLIEFNCQLRLDDLVTRNPDKQHGAIYITGLEPITKVELEKITDTVLRQKLNKDLRLLRETIHQILDRVDKHNKK